MAPGGEAIGKEKKMPCLQQQNEIQKNKHDQGWLSVVRDEHHCHTSLLLLLLLLLLYIEVNGKLSVFSP